jgi:hypothetical protein
MNAGHHARDGEEHHPTRNREVRPGKGPDAELMYRTAMRGAAAGLHESCGRTI